MRKCVKKHSLFLFKNTSTLKFVAVFALALFLRALPEFLSGAYPVGFDASAGYVPAVLALPDGSPMVLFGWVYSPLTIYLLWFVRVLTNVDVYLLLKVAGPVFYGLFGVSFCYMLSQGLGWSDKKSFVVSLLLLLQPAIMRMGWDQFREELGLMLFFVLLALTRMDLVKGARSKPFFVVVLSVLIVFSHQLAAILFFVVAIFQFFDVVIKKQEFWHIFITILPAAIIFIWQIYMSYLVDVEFNSRFVPLYLTRGTELFVFKNYFLSDPRFLGGDYWTVLSYVGCLSLYVVVPLIPLAMKGFFKDRVFMPILVWLTITSFSILVFPWFAFAEYWWWILLLPIPLTIYVGHSLEKAEVFINVKRMKKVVVALLLLGVVSFGYASSVIKIGYPYAYYYLPAGMVESSIPIEDIPELENALEWTNTNAPTNTTVLVPEKFQGFAYVKFRQDINIIIAPPLMNLEEVNNMVNWEEKEVWAVYYLKETGDIADEMVELMISEQVGVFKK